jgi:PadR family transcriptional regulator, regulatory protein PadR
MSKRELLGTFEQLCLTAVLRLQATEEGAYGYSIVEEIEKRTGKVVSLSQVHMTLQRMAEAGLLESTLGATLPGRSGRPRRLFRLTGSGERSLELTWRVLNDMYPVGFRPSEA